MEPTPMDARSPMPEEIPGVAPTADGRSPEPEPEVERPSTDKPRLDDALRQALLDDFKRNEVAYRHLGR